MLREYMERTSLTMSKFPNIHPSAREAVDDALSDPVEMAECGQDWEAYDFFLTHGYNPNINYTLYERAWLLLLGRPAARRPREPGRRHRPAA